MRRLAAICLAVLVAGCPKAPPPKKAPERPATPQAAVRETLRHAYAALEERDTDALQGFFTFDALVYGLSPAETFNSRVMVLERVRQVMSPPGSTPERLRLSDSSPHVGLAEGGQSAWLYDFPKATVGAKGDTQVYSPRVTAHLVHEGDTWLIDALHVSLGVPDARTATPDATRKYLPPFEVKAERGKDSDQVIGLTKRMLEDFAIKVEHTSDRGEVAIINTDPNDIVLGGKVFKDLIRPRLAEIRKSAFSLKIDGPLRARLAPDGKSGWLAASIVLRMGAGKKQVTYPAYRALWLFAEEAGVWNVVSEHLSLALKPEQFEAATRDELDARQKRLSAAPPETGGSTSTPPGPPRTEPADGPKKPSKPKGDDVMGTFE